MNYIPKSCFSKTILLEKRLPEVQVITHKNRTYYVLFAKTNSSHIADQGWGNGYVAIPKDNEFYELDYDDIPVDIHNGLTYAKSAESTKAAFRYTPGTEIIPDDYWVIGFDTVHTEDTLEKWPMYEVIKETDRLLTQIIERDNQ